MAFSQNSVRCERDLFKAQLEKKKAEVHERTVQQERDEAYVARWKKFAEAVRSTH